MRVVKEERVKRVVTGDKVGGEGEGDGGKGCRGSKGGEGGKNGLSGQVCQKNSKREKMNTLHWGWVFLESSHKNRLVFGEQKTTFTYQIF